MEGGLWHATVTHDKAIAQYRLSWVTQQVKGSELTAWSQHLPGYVEEGSYCDAAVVPVVPQPKSQPLELCQLGGAGTLIVLNACPSDIRRNLAPWKSNLYQICYLQCTFMADVVVGLHKK